MSIPFLEVTYQRGKAFAAHLHLSSDSSIRSHRARAFDDRLFVVDFDRRKRPLGVEIVNPSVVSVGGFNRLLAQLGVTEVSKRDLAPLLAA